LAAVALIEVNPFLATDFGFALSVAATAGILMVTPWLFKKFRKVMPVWMAGVFSVSAAAQIWCAPILLQLQPGLPT
jgi:competence protein ComEC